MVTKHATKDRNGAFRFRIFSWRASGVNESQWSSDSLSVERFLGLLLKQESKKNKQDGRFFLALNGERIFSSISNISVSLFASGTKTRRLYLLTPTCPAY